MRRNHWIPTVAFLSLVAVLCLLTHAPQPARAAEPMKHQVIGSDDLHLLAGYYYLDPRRWTDIYAANQGVIRKPSLLEPGMVLTIPGEGLKPFPMPYQEWKAKVETR